MKKTTLTLLLMIVSAHLFAQVNATPWQSIDSLMGEAVRMNLFSGNILIMHDHRIAYEKSFGKANYENDIPVTPDTKFQLASITKDFTRVMILELAEQHKLSLNGRLGKYLGGFSDEANKVTISQLLYFTSGFGDYHNTPEFQQLEGKKPVIKDLIPIIRKEQLQFEPGSQVLYSNSGYVVLGAIIEQVSGKSYLDCLHQLILDRLDLKNTSMNGYTDPLPGIATGYLTNELGPPGNNSGWQLAGGGDGGIYTTASDLMKFINAVFYGDLLLSDSSKLLFVTDMREQKKFTEWSDFQKGGRYSPAGGAPGVSSMYGINMRTSNIFIVLSNYDQGSAEEAGFRIGAILNNKPVPPFRQPPQKYLYSLIKSKGGKSFEDNYKEEMQNSGMQADDDMVLLYVGEQLVRDEDYSNAVCLFRVYTAEFPRIIIAWNELGESYLKLGDKQNSKRCFQQALQNSPGNVRAREGLEKSE